MDKTNNDAASSAAQSSIEGASTPTQTDSASELSAMWDRLAKLESEKAEADRQVAENARVAKIATAKANVISKYLAGDFELDSFLPNTEDTATLEAAALKLQKKFKALRPAFGGGNDGGTIPGREPADHKPIPASQLIQRAFKPRD